jgi:hypothetical protein
MDLSAIVSSAQIGLDGGRFASDVEIESPKSMPSGSFGNVSVSDQKRRVEMKQTLDKKKSVAKKPQPPARRASLRQKPEKTGQDGKAPEAPRPLTTTTSTNANQVEIKEELVADHELDILLDSFESETFTGVLPIEPNSHGDDPSATDELWRRLSNTAWIRNPESTADDGNSSTVAHR